MKPSQMRRLLLQLLPAHEPVLLVGSPGVGKTTVIEAVTKELDYDLIVTHPVVDDPTDYKGMPAVATLPSGELGANFLPFGDLWKMIQATRPTVVFMDDLGQAPPAVQAAIMQLVLARKINGHPVSEHVRFVAATNRRQDKAAVTGLITPLLDRFTTVITMDFDLEDWISWGVSAEMPPELLAFARFKPDLFGKFEASKDMQKSPTPRSIAGLGRLVNAGIEEFEVLAGATGDKFATEFIAFAKTWKELPDVRTIYANPEKALVPERTDVRFALMGALANSVDKDTFSSLMKYLNRVPAEFRVLCVRDTLLRKPVLAATKDFNRWAREHKDLFSIGAR